MREIVSPLNIWKVCWLIRVLFEVELNIIVEEVIGVDESRWMGSNEVCPSNKLNLYSS